MPVNKQAYLQLKNELDKSNVTLVAVSKTKPVEDIQALYDLGHRDFGENYVREMVDKAADLPADIRWHFIGHLQTNKVKYISSFVQLIQGVDSLKLLNEINKRGEKDKRVLNCLLQVHIAREESKFGMDEKELEDCLDLQMANVRICGMMGMASFVEDKEKIRTEFAFLKGLIDKYKQHHKPHFELSILSMGMSNDYTIAIETGSTMVRIGSLLFGDR